MKKTIVKLTGIALIACAFSAKTIGQNYVMNQTPLVPQKYIELPLGAIKPEGWLLEQLQIMQKGSAGHLDEYYWKLKNDNGWLGGKGDGWEETPYWLDGAVPLAYLLDDKALKAKVQKYIDWTINNPAPFGLFWPHYQIRARNWQTGGERGPGR